MKVGGKWVMYKAHRFAVEYFTGVKLSDSDHVCHHCDNPVCVNPNHLYVGNEKTNTEDKMKRGRHGYGIRDSHKKLSPDDVFEIRELYRIGLRQKNISDKTGVSTAQVSRIVNHKIHSRVEHAGG